MIQHVKRAAKWTGGSVVVLIVLLLVDLYTVQWMLEDPGYYVVARRSDTPEQVVDALEKLRKDPEVTEQQIRVLIDRYRAKARSRSLSDSEREVWKRALRKARKLWRARRERAPP